MADSKMPASRCCHDMRKAFQDGTDNEGYGSLAYQIDDEIIFGCELPPINFCPWCGKSQQESR